MFSYDDCQNDEKDEFVKSVDQDIEEGFEYWTGTMKNTAFKTFTMKLLLSLNISKAFLKYARMP